MFFKNTVKAMEKFSMSSLRNKYACNVIIIFIIFDILKVFVTTGMYTMCLGMGSPTSYTLFDIGYRLS